MNTIHNDGESHIALPLKGILTKPLDDGCKVDSKPARESSPRENKSLTFNEDENTTLDIPSISQLSDDDKKAIWYTQHEYHSFKKEARGKSKKISAHYSHYAVGVEDVFAQGKAMVSSYRFETLDSSTESEWKEVSSSLFAFKVVNLFFLLTSLLSSSLLQQPLFKWCKHADFRGLERFVSPVFQYHRQSIKDDVSYIAALSRSNASPEKLASTYHLMVAPYTYFAQLKGEADERCERVDAEIGALKGSSGALPLAAAGSISRRHSALPTRRVVGGATAPLRRSFC